jgi:methionine synthase II (cobalamin-independent)
MKGELIVIENFQANCLPVLIGSLPMDDHTEAIKLVFRYTPEIPLWVQLPVYKEEGMIAQFLPGLPGLTIEKERAYIDTGAGGFGEDLLKFYEDYMAVTEGEFDLSESRFVLTEDTAGGFIEFMKQLKAVSVPPVAVKGQITGPVTFCTGMNDQDGKAIFYDEQIRDVAVKLLAQKARWQVRELSKFGVPVIIFFDEPALAGIGSSAFISITNDEVAKCLNEVIEAVHSEGGLAGIHVCANSDWSIVLGSSAEIVSFDAYSFFDRFILYADYIRKFLESGRILAWGIVPTSNAEDVEKETVDSLVIKWEDRVRELESLGFTRSKILAQSLITPSCGTGSLSLENATKVLRLTREVSDRLRARSKITSHFDAQIHPA